MAYTIAVVQNTQTYQFEQMQIAFQTAQNQASIETPLQAEQLMHAHFNLALLQNTGIDNKQSNAMADKTAIVDNGPSTSATEQETRVKTTYKYSSGSKCAATGQLTGTVPPTCRQTSDVVNGIPVGYESDDSWHSHSNDIEQMPRRDRNIIPLVAIRSWSGRPGRGRGQNYRQNNNFQRCDCNALQGHTAVQMKN